MSITDPFSVQVTESPPGVRLDGPSIDEIKPGPVVKECRRAHQYEPHRQHPWSKFGEDYLCEGIPPPEEQPECLIYISPEQPKCGRKAPAKIRIKTKLTDARIPACLQHKAEYDHNAALLRQRSIRKAS